MSESEGITETAEEIKTGDSDNSVRQQSNPYYFPQDALYKGPVLNGVRIVDCPVSDDSLTHMKKIRNLSMRNNDMIIAAYPKCGTHWVAEIVHMLLTGSAEYSARSKEHAMLEFIPDLSALDQMTSPRLFNSHLCMAHLPAQIVEKNVKIIHLIRNPKDTAVSFYHDMRQGYDAEKFTFDNFLKGYTTEGYMGFPAQFDYLRQMTQFERDNPGHSIMHIHYEDLKKTPVPIIQELAEYIGVTVGREFCQDVATACCFEQLKKASDDRDLPENLATFNLTSIYRKGGYINPWT
ncbi:gliomedin-like isoform x3 [Plakobranchus ocellatus]|uniref:Gliomedin-like isoform x3 n=1 Tax=Plakobranchus ocellatus TaxID=259542 RepID=A0AAV3ZU16_9GAST|nr:gliomedin-like isoform x3 [Plakobranchus ocellatus]